MKLIIYSIIIIFLLTIDEISVAQINGTVKGKIEIEEKTKTNRRQRTGYNQHQHGNEQKISNETENVVVYLEEIGSKGNYTYSGKTPVLTQKNAEFIPKVLPILKGTTINIKNEDKIYHNVFSLSDPKSFNIGRRPKGETVPQTFNKSGVVRVFCDIHSHMSAFIIILDNPFFATGNKNGNYEINNIPPGKYKLNVWHDNFEFESVEININSGETKTVNIELK